MIHGITDTDVIHAGTILSGKLVDALTTHYQHFVNGRSMNSTTMFY